ncbi:sarcosine oxidase subunit alpha family protein [Xanthobacter sp. YC-JY1]|uniref:sarcosine oxidase subunit alpha family protein n=1 Tax=Xanthobacter sp. YC-JY1 TaxID=2419844 RepID=UPI001F00950A|nr:sarcosine oxidase subunit alpha family protein [Xanthobacter sp. YC-JY1]UJX44935.1 sarcosine oxidase subunit alpha family protein [Xanthobacter sp. YC-JY1]
MTRLSAGGLIDRSRTLSFSFDGKSYTGHPGDTLASALLANGVRLVGRSFKYHRPRGIVTAGSEEPNALVELRSGARREPNTRATTIELFDALEATSQNRWPSLDVDLLSMNQLVSPFLGAGFYYKTFMWPAAFWEKVYEPMIRRAAGLGRAAEAADPDHYEKATHFCDVLVIGSGAAGLAAALAAGRSGARAVLTDEDFRLGGRLLSEQAEIDGRSAADFVARALAELSSLPNVRLMPRTTVFGAYDGGEFGAVEKVSDHLAVPAPFQPRQRLWRFIAKRSVLAAGAFDRPIVFPGNDRPGVMSALALATYATRFGVGAGPRAAGFTNNDHAVAALLDAAAAGVKLEAIADVREAVAPALAARAKALGVDLLTGSEVIATSGKCLSSVTVRTPKGVRTLSVEALGVSGGATPNVNLTCHQGGRPIWREDIAAFVPGALPVGMAVAGAAAGHLTLAESLADGTALGAAAAEDAGFAPVAAPAPVAGDAPNGLKAFWQVHAKGPAFVDQQNDVTAKDVALAHREGFRAVELLKRYTTMGMATDQGKTSNMAGLAIMAELTGKGIPQTGTTVFRPPYTPVALGVLAGHHRGVDFKPSRPTPTHQWAEEQGAVFVETGQWLRAAWFPKAGEDWQAAVNREVKATRESVGVIDVSTFGKIDLQGPDAGRLLDRVYINMFSTLGVGKARYGVMLREDGIVMDDGTTARLADDHYVMTTTTANAAKVFQHLEFCLQVLWPELDVCLASITEQWAQIAVSGPRSRDVLAKLVDGADVSNTGLPFMGALQTTVMGGVEARVFRLSFSGELGYEIAVPARHGDALMRAIMAAGAPYGITPYGVETLAVLRIEKGHVSGSELNGQTSARDLGLGRMASTKKDFIGRVMAGRPAFTDPDRPTFVGFRPVDRSARLKAGAHFLALGAAPTTENDEGYMTSVAYSPILGHSIGLGLLKRGPERIGETLRAYDPVRGGDIEVEVCSPHFVDPEGEKQRV